MRTLLTLLLACMAPLPMAAQSYQESNARRQMNREFMEAIDQRLDTYMAFMEQVGDRPADYYTTMKTDSAFLMAAQQEFEKDLELSRAYSDANLRVIRLVIDLTSEKAALLAGDWKVQTARVDSITTLCHQRYALWNAAVEEFKQGDKKAIRRFMRDGMKR